MCYNNCQYFWENPMTGTDGCSRGSNDCLDEACNECGFEDCECEEEDKTKLVISVNHGRQFGCAQWFTFYCPHCNQSIVREGEDDSQECRKCGDVFKWVN